MSKDMRETYTGEKLVSTLRARLSWAADQVVEPTALFGLTLVPERGWAYAKAGNRLMENLSLEEAVQMFQTLRVVLGDVVLSYAEERGWDAVTFAKMSGFGEGIFRVAVSECDDHGCVEMRGHPAASRLMSEFLTRQCIEGKMESFVMEGPGVFKCKCANTHPGE